MSRWQHKDFIDGMMVSTVEITTDVRMFDFFLDRELCEFETMIFPADKNNKVTDWKELYVKQYTTKEEAILGHMEVMEHLQSGMSIADLKSERLQ